VPSVEFESTTIISSATPSNDFKHASIFLSSLKEIIVALNLISFTADELVLNIKYQKKI
jgi:hypothetical protein